MNYSHSECLRENMHGAQEKEGVLGQEWPSRNKGRLDALCDMKGNLKKMIWRLNKEKVS